MNNPPDTRKPLPGPPRRPPRVVEENAAPQSFDVRESPTRSRMRSSDDLAAVLAAEEHERRQRELLAEKQRLQAELEQERERRAAIEASRRIPATVQREETPDSLPPPTKGEALRGSFRVGDLRGWAALLVAVPSLGVAIASWVDRRPAPIVVDGTKEVTALAGRIGELERDVAKLKKLADDQGAFIAAALDASCIKTRRPASAGNLPSLDVTYPVKKPTKCPSVRVETLWPTFATTELDRP